jgi:hypothetical protein
MQASGDDGRARRRPGTGWARLRRPDRLVAQTRWLFTLLTAASVVVAAPALLMASGHVPRLLAGAGCAGLVAVWVYRYRTGSATVLLGVVEAALMLTSAVAAVDMATVFAYLFASLWLRALYGSGCGMVLHTGLVAVATIAVPVVWPLLPERPAQRSTGTVTVLGSPRPQ